MVCSFKTILRSFFCPRFKWLSVWSLHQLQYYHIWHLRSQLHSKLDHSSPYQKGLLPVRLPLFQPLIQTPSLKRVGIVQWELIPNHSMVPVLYLTSMPVFVKNSAPRRTSYFQVSDWNMSAFCWLTFLFLSNSGSLRLCTITISVEV